MRIDVYQKDDFALFKIAGRLVLEECDAFSSVIGSRIVPGLKAVFIALTNVEYLDSAGLGALVDVKVKASENQLRLGILEPSAGVANILNISKLSEIFEIITGLDAAQIIDDAAKPIYLAQSVDTLDSALGISTTAAPAARPDAAPDPAATQAAGREPGGVEMHCRHAVENLRQGDLEASVASYKKALELDPNYIPARNNLAIVYEKKPEWRDLAIEQWQQLMELCERHHDDKHVERARKHLAVLQAR